METTLGTIWLPSTPGTPVGRFMFLVAPEHGDEVEVGSMVAADTDEGTLVGSVIDMRTHGSDPDPVRADLSAGVGARIGGIREVMIAEVQVFDSPAMRPPRAGTVRAATPAEVEVATGGHRIDWKIPAGVIDLIGGDRCGVHFDGEAIFGPESQGISVGGLSGQAAKSSYISVLLRGAIAAGNEDDHRVAVLAFNVKGQDLLYLDQPAWEKNALQDADIEMYRALGIPAEPFPDVEVWSPCGYDDLPTSSRQDAQRLRWDLRTAWDNLYLLDPDLLQNDTSSAFIHSAREALLDSKHNPVDTFGKLFAFFDDQIADCVENDRTTGWGDTHISTLRKLNRRFRGIKAKARGLFIDGRGNDADDVPTEGWRNGQVRVVDVANLPPEVQGFVIARTVKRMMESAEEGRLGVDHLIVVADEGNQWAPNVGGDYPEVRKALRRVATQGRYAGVSLCLAGQALSKIDELIRDNASTRALGVTAEAELASGAYGRLPAGLAERLATLEKGSMALWHYSFRNALLVKFPRPAWAMGRAPGAVRRDISGLGAVRNHLRTQGMSDTAIERATDGLTAGQIETIVGEADNVEEATSEVLARREPDVTQVRLHERSDYNPADDPWGLDT